MFTLITFSFSLLICAISAEYNGYKFVDIFPNSVENLKVVSTFGDEKYDVIRRARNVGQQATLFLKPDQVEKTTYILEQNGVTYSLRDPNFSRVNSTRTRRFVRPGSGDEKPSSYYNTAIYQSFDDQMAFLDEVAHDNPSFVSVATLGKSFLKREIKYVTIGYPSINRKPALLIDAGIHAREWIAPAVALWTIQELTSSDKYRNLLQKVDIVIIPNLNPDGYEYSRDSLEGARMWRKNRTPQAGSECYGVDLNRNFPFKFGVAGTSSDPCSEIFKGRYALSEPEAYLLRTFMDQNKESFKAYLTLHSYGQNWVYPWGYAMKTYPPDVQDLINVGNQAAKAIASVRGTQYMVSSSADGMYAAAGASDDFAKSLGIKYVYTVELSPSERETRYDFDLPEEFILPTAREAFQGFLVVAETIAK